MNVKKGMKIGRREWLRKAGKVTAAACGMTLLPSSIEKALAIPPAQITGTLMDVQHVVILMQENRSFDHYFGTMSGVRGFGDRILVPGVGGKPVWSQSDGTREILPFHLDTQTTSAMRVPTAPHSWPDSQLAWNHGNFGKWPRFKEFQSMGYYEADDIPFQRALADAFTVCDAHHCSVQSGTLSNRAMFMTGTNCRPGMTAPASQASDAFIDNSNNRGLQSGPFTWTTLPERLQANGVSWRIYQDPQENWDGLFAPWEAFAAYKSSAPGAPLYDNAMTRWTLDEFAQHVVDETLPQVSWIVPSPVWSEHPATSSPLQGGAFTQRVLESLIASPDVWSRTVLIITFDENDGMFDHVPPPAPPSIDEHGIVLGETTLENDKLAGLYYRNEIDGVVAARPYGLGPRVPLYIVSPWSRGGWVCSEVFDHTSTIRFLEARFGIQETNISAWHRSVSGDLTSCLDFGRANNEPFPMLPDLSSATNDALVIDLPPVQLPAKALMPSQDPGIRLSRALPYRLAVHAVPEHETANLVLHFENTGAAGAVFHVYDGLNPESAPWRYTVEAAKTLKAIRDANATDGRYDLHILGPASLFWRFAGQLPSNVGGLALPEVRLRSSGALQTVELSAWNLGDATCDVHTVPNAYRSDRMATLTLIPGVSPVTISWPVHASGFWYDFSVECASIPGWSRRFAGRVETGRHGISDPALGGFANEC
jgi:phospholipase C